MISQADLSPDRLYRYTLRRTWDSTLPQILFIGLNPSTADAQRDDPTLRRCIGFARRWGYGQLVVGNLFAFRATRPTELRSCADPIGTDNDSWLQTLAASAGCVVVAWGTHGQYMGR